MGLATVQQIIERHHGRIWPKGAPGEGATFFFTLQSADRSGEALRGICGTVRRAEVPAKQVGHHAPANGAARKSDMAVAKCVNHVCRS